MAFGYINIMENKTYTIKDIARMAGVSAGTVDRVLHNRGDVSAASKEKVQKILDEIDYRPNIFAIGLAAKKPYHIICVIPYYIENDYWHSVASGIKRATEEFMPFNVSVSYCQYRHTDAASYETACKQITQEPKCDAVLIAPNFTEQTIELTQYLDEKKIPYVFIDFNIEQAHALSYIGQNSRSSGYIAAKILMRSYKPEDEIIVILNNQKHNPAEIQMQRRMEGFMKYIADRYREVTIHDLVLDKDDDYANEKLLDKFFEENPKAQLGVVFNSRVYQFAHYLQRRKRKVKSLIGYDLMPRNMAFLKSGEVNYLLGQRPSLQGYCGVKILCDHIMLKKPVASIKYMPIDILMKENIDYYFEFE